MKALSKKSNLNESISNQLNQKKSALEKFSKILIIRNNFKGIKINKLGSSINLRLSLNSPYLVNGSLSNIDTGGEEINFKVVKTWNKKILYYNLTFNSSNLLLKLKAECQSSNTVEFLKNIFDSIKEEVYNY